MKKNLFSDNKKGSKGFYAALGISAVMIGSACYFAYDQGEKLTEDMKSRENSSQSETPVDRRVDNVPKVTSAGYRATLPVRTAPPVVTAAPVITAPPVATLPASAIVVQEEPVAAVDEAENVSSVKMENAKAPLSDMENIIGTFSGGELVKSETTGSWQTHNGTDIAAEVGAEVYAVSNGEVKDIAKDPVWGVTLTIDHHNGYVTRYCGLSDGLEVQKGDALVSGDLIGTVGNTADIESALSPHLHIEMTHNGNYIDPMSELNRANNAQ